MFLDYYHLREQPFGVTPDPRFLYLSRTHREAIASLYYGVEASRGFMALIAEPGMGKTTLLFQLMERVRKSACFAFLFQTQCDSREFLRYLLADMGIESRGYDLVEMHEQLNAALMRLSHAGMRFVLLIDEAQNLDDRVLETVRLLSDFETPSAKLMQIILSGQPQLALKLARPALAQLRQRIAILSRLEPFSVAETSEYIAYRLRVAGDESGRLFTSEATSIIADRSQGIPRNINNLCFNALSMGCALGQKKIDAEIVLEAVRDLDVVPLAEAETRNSKRENQQPAIIDSIPAFTTETQRHGFENGNSKFENRQAAYPETTPTCHPERSEGSALPPNPQRDSSLRCAPLRMTSEPGAAIAGEENRNSEIANHQSPITNGKSAIGNRQSAILSPAFAACLLLAFLFLLPSFWRSLGTPFPKVGSSVATPAARSTGPKGLRENPSSLSLPGMTTLPPAVSPPPPAAQSARVERAPTAAPRAAQPAVIVVVKPRKTLYRICIEHFGRFDRDLVRQIRALNPRITNPRIIAIGQRIVLPTPTLKSPGSDSAGRASVEPTASVRN